MSKTTLAVLIGNRDFFPKSLVGEARQDLAKILPEFGVDPVMLPAEGPGIGALQTWQDAVRCGELLRRHGDDIIGILIVLPNFGDEKAIADAVRLSQLNVPILVQAYPDDLDQFGVERRRDAFCGKISVCNNLKQYGFEFSLTRDHTVSLLSDGFREDFRRFLQVCRVVRGLRGVRIGAVGARPNAFNTTRFSEKLLENAGISVNTIDLSEVFGRAARIQPTDARVSQRIEQIKSYADSSQAPQESLVRMAKFAVVLDEWMNDLGLRATAIQCWSSMQENFGVNVCTIMSMMSQEMMPSACEVDIAGVVSMYALQLASGKPSGLVDWNNNYGKDADKCVFFHCGNWAKDFLPDIRIATAPILGTVLGEENTVGALSGRTPAGPVTYARISTNDLSGKIHAYAGEGMFTDDPLNTFGTKAVVRVPRLQSLMQHICRSGFEHHVAMNGSHCAESVAEALESYFGWDVYLHQA
ncbi:MAG TPA: L-fucose/L-arabinose isomerase family protein [Terriglobales bacterium]|nr:L-fucose/L-arabinose isomerase family protein [Terriglobales bacterium]